MLFPFHHAARDTNIISQNLWNEENKRINLSPAKDSARILIVPSINPCGNHKHQETGVEETHNQLSKKNKK